MEELTQITSIAQAAGLAVWVPTAGAVTGVAVAAGIGLPRLRRHNARGRRILRRWARGYRLRVRHARVRLLRRGPFLTGSSARQVVFRVTFEDRAGGLRRAFVRVGHRWIGTGVRQVSVKWDGVPGVVHEKV